MAARPGLYRSSARVAGCCVLHQEGDLDAISDLELDEQPGNVCLDGGQAHMQPDGNLGVGGSVGDRGRHLALPRREPGQPPPCPFPAGGRVGIAGDEADQAAGYPG